MIMSSTSLIPLPVRLGYTLIVFGAGLIIFSFAWYVMFEIVMPIRWAATQALNNLPANNSTNTTYVLADAFVSHLWQFMLVFGTIALITWAFIYMQHKGRVLQ
jgi:hypothetical protein